MTESANPELDAERVNVENYALVNVCRVQYREQRFAHMLDLAATGRCFADPLVVAKGGVSRMRSLLVD